MDTFLGTISMYGLNYAPRGWHMCDGSLMSISANQALFALLGSNFGGDARTTFGLPDLRGRVPVGWGHGTGLSPNQLGQKGGFETHNLTVDQLPPHNHAATAASTSTSTSTAHATNAAGSKGSPNGEMLAAGANEYAPYDSANTVALAANAITTETQTTTDVTVLDTGSGMPVPNLQPFQVVTFCICIEGIFPPRD